MGTYATVLIFFCVLVLLSISQATHSEGIDVENGVINVTLSPHSELCERVRVSSISRLKLGSYASVYRVALFPAVDIPERYHSKIQICFHQNASLGLCQCKKDEWKSVGKELWRSVMSPYKDRYVDVKFDREVSGSVTITVEEEFQRWRLFCLALGLILLVLAPIVSSWVPFYYSSSMAIGVFLVILILLFQGMKLLPTGRKNVFYLTIYGSVLGAGSFLLHHFSLFVNSILVNFGLSEEMHNPVSILVLVFIVLAGAALGYWIVRKFVISEDGSVDGGIAQFVKWAMRIIAITFIFQSTFDTPLAVGAMVFCFAICFLITSPEWHILMYQSYFGDESSWPLKDKRATAKYKRAEFFSRSKNVGARGTLWNSPRSLSPWSNSPVKGLVSPPSRRGSTCKRDYYSSFHKTPNRRQFSKKEWKEFTEESTRQAVSDWASSPEFADWIIKRADRIQVHPDESSDEMMGSGSDSTHEDGVESSNNGYGSFKRT